jgi:Major intrinsic protein
MPLSKKLGAEFIGTFWLVLGGCGSAVLAAKFPEIGIGLVGVSLAFGLTVLTMAYAVGHISGGHFNPAVTVGLFAGGRIPAGELLPYRPSSPARSPPPWCCTSLPAESRVSTSPPVSPQTATASIRRAAIP